MLERTNELGKREVVTFNHLVDRAQLSTLALGQLGARKERTGTAFGQVDLLTVIGVLLLLAFLLTPALAHTRLTDQAFQCRNNLRRLVQAWRMYADDYNGALPANPNGGVTSGKCWAYGWEDFTSNNPDNTNLLYLTEALLGPYVNKQTALFKCPADLSICQEWGQPMPRVRSVSMNAFIEGGAYLGDHDAYSSLWYENWWSYQKISDILNPVPSMLFVFADEQADSINDCWFITTVDNLNGWTDLPASYHGGACGISFADGHVEIHAWRDTGTQVPMIMQQYNSFPGPSPHDKPWLIQRSSAKSR
jgi:prepilin-type processing-associated H-X9-DG protein